MLLGISFDALRQRQCPHSIFIGIQINQVDNRPDFMGNCGQIWVVQTKFHGHSQSGLVSDNSRIVHLLPVIRYDMGADINKAKKISRGIARKLSTEHDAHRLIREAMTRLEVLLREGEFDRCASVVDTGLLERLGNSAWATEVGCDLGLELRVAARNVLP